MPAAFIADDANGKMPPAVFLREPDQPLVIAKPSSPERHGPLFFYRVDASARGFQLREVRRLHGLGEHR